MRPKWAGPDVDERTGANNPPPVPPDHSKPPFKSRENTVTCSAADGSRYPRALKAVGQSRYFGRKHIKPGSDLPHKCVEVTLTSQDTISIIVCNSTLEVFIRGNILRAGGGRDLREGNYDCQADGHKFKLSVEYNLEKEE